MVNGTVGNQEKTQVALCSLKQSVQIASLEQNIPSCPPKWVLLHQIQRISGTYSIYYTQILSHQPYRFNITCSMQKHRYPILEEV